MMRGFYWMTRLGAGLGSILLAGNVWAQAASLEAISKLAPPRPHSGGDSWGVELSGDGRWAAIVSSANGLTTNDHNGLTLDLFLRDMVTGETTMITRGLAGAGASDDSYSPRISEDGRWIAFESAADDLVEDDVNEGSDVFVYDRTSGAIRLISQTAEAGAEGEATLLAASPDGRFVVFSSTAEDLAGNDTNKVEDVFIWDRESGETRLVTMRWDGTKTAAGTVASVPIEAVVSGDGRYVAHVSLPRDLVKTVPNNLTNAPQVFVWDRTSGTNKMVAPNLADATLTSPMGSSAPVFSTNGARLAFVAENSSGTSVPAQVWVYETATGELKRSPAPFANPSVPQPAASEPALSADGNLLAFVYDGQIALHDFTTGAGVLLSKNQNGERSDGGSSEPRISADGSTILFTGFAQNLASEDGLGNNQLFRFDRATGKITLASAALGGATGADSDIYFPELSSDGRVAAFTSVAGNLAGPENPRLNDVYIVHLGETNRVELLSTAHSSSVSETLPAASRVEPGALSQDGRYVAFVSDSSDLAAGDKDEALDLFLRDLQNGETRLLSQPIEGATNTAFLAFGAMSANGRIVLYTSTESFVGSNVVCLVAYDTVSRTREIASVLPNGSLASRASGVSVSADGRYVSFVEALSGTGQVYVRDLLDRTTKQATGVSAAGTFISPNGRYVMTTGGSAMRLWDRLSAGQLPATLRSVRPVDGGFTSDQKFFLLSTGAPSRFEVLYEFSLPTLSSNIVATNVADAPVFVTPGGGTALYTRQTASGTNLVALDLATRTERVLEIEGKPVFRMRGASAGTPDGRHVVVGVSNGAPSEAEVVFSQLYAFDLWLTNATLVSRSLAGGAGDAPGTSPSISADGRTIVFDSLASDLVPNDRNNLNDVFVARMAVADANSNGLEDGWERRHLPPGGTAASDDDGDGASNLLEYLSGTDPADPASVLEIVTALHMREPPAILIYWNGVIGRKYQLQHRASLVEGAWSDVGQPRWAPETGEMLEVQPLGGGAGFFRLVPRP